MWASRCVYHSRPGRHHRQYVPLAFPPKSLPCQLCVELTKGHVGGKPSQATSVSVSVSVLTRATRSLFMSPMAMTVPHLDLAPKGVCLMLHSEAYISAGMAPSSDACQLASDPKFSGRSVALPQVQPWSLHTPSWGTAQSRQIDKGARRERRGPSRSICRRPLPRPLHPV